MDNVERVRIGFRAMNFSLTDSIGEFHRLSDFSDKKSVVLVFLPKASWEYSKPFLKKWEEILYKIENLPGVILAVSCEYPTRCYHLKKELGLTFPILWDENCFLAEFYGVLNLNQNQAHPSIFLIDAQGIIRYKEIFTEPEKQPSLDGFLRYLKS